ncbi:MAG: MFS transporter [Spirochaetia bacterium]|jgi:EmrB/QacA subfamily drug resistance transporter
MHQQDGTVDKRVVLFVASTASFLTPFMASSINIAIPSIGREFSADAITLSWISTAYLLAAAMFLVPMGRVADIHGRRKVFLAGMAGYSVVSLLCALAASEAMLIALRALQGFTDAMMFGTSLAIVTSVYPPAQRGRALGITVASVYAGGALGPFIGGMLTQFLGWRSIFLLTMVLGLFVTGLALWKVRGEWAEARGQKMDVVGSLFYACTLFAVMYGFRLLPAVTGLWLIIGGAVLLAAFVWRESRVASPVLDISLFRRNSVFALSNLSALINYAATFALSFLLSLFLQYIKGFSPRSAGLIMLTQPVMMAVFSPLAGRLSDRVEPRIVASAGMAMSTAGLLLTAFLGRASSLAHIIAILMLCGLGFGLFSSPNTSAIMGSVERKYYAVASATTGAMRLIGQMLSMGIAALIIAVYVGEVEIAPERYAAFLSAFRAGFFIFAALCGVGIFASLFRGRMHA